MSTDAQNKLLSKYDLQLCDSHFFKCQIFQIQLVTSQEKNRNLQRIESVCSWTSHQNALPRAQMQRWYDVLEQVPTHRIVGIYVKLRWQPPVRELSVRSAGTFWSRHHVVLGILPPWFQGSRYMDRAGPTEQVVQDSVPNCSLAHLCAVAGSWGVRSCLEGGLACIKQ